VTYDGDSLRKNNQDIAHDQTERTPAVRGALRYIGTRAGQRRARRSEAGAYLEVVCKASPGPTGSVTLSAARSPSDALSEERKSHLRVGAKFESLVKISLKLGSADPYQDEECNKLAQLPNPVTNTRPYCLING